MPADEDNKPQPITQKILSKAVNKNHSLEYIPEKAKGKATIWKCNQFVANVLTEAGASPGKPNGNPIKKFLGLGAPPVANQWADPNYNIRGWIIVTTLQAGHVVAVNNGANSGHVAIMTSSLTSIGAGLNEVHFTFFGSDSSMLTHWVNNRGYVYRRYVGNGN